MTLYDLWPMNVSISLITSWRFSLRTDLLLLLSELLPIDSVERIYRVLQNMYCKFIGQKWAENVLKMSLKLYYCSQSPILSVSQSNSTTQSIAKKIFWSLICQNDFCWVSCLANYLLSSGLLISYYKYLKTH